MNFFKNSYFPLETTAQDVKFLFEMVRKSPYISGNSDYDKKAKNTKVKFDAHNEMINAYANSRSADVHDQVIFQGICNTAKLTAIALAQFKEDCNIGRLKETCNWIGIMAIENHYRFPVRSIEQGLEDLNYSTEGIIGVEAKSYTAGAILSVIAHEQGHICLSHTLREDVSDEVSRNDERQADLFGLNVSATTPFTSHIVLATLFVEIIFTWMSGNEDIATTHPHSRERVYNTLNGHDVVLKALGITKDNIDGFLP